MNCKVLKNSFSLPVLGMGTWCFGGRESHDPDNDDVSQIDALQYGIDLGYSLIDTAEYYAAGYAEVLTGRAIADFDRSKIMLCSKVWKTNLRYTQVLDAARRSLDRLGTGYLDLYLYHQVSDEVPLEETMEAMNELAAQKLVRHIGVSNFAVPRLERAMRCSSFPVVVNQVHYNLRVREPELGLLDFCRSNDVMLQAWRPQRDLKPCDLTEELCRKYDCSLQQLALAFLIGQEQVTTITASSNIEHLKENRRAAQIVLDDDDMRRLKNDMPDVVYCGGVPLS